jgi:hypothetical protein
MRTDLAEPARLTLGSFAVGAEGGLVPSGDPQRPPALRFAWRGRPCEALLGGDGMLRLAAIAARIPSTADPRADRGGAFAAVAAARPSLPEGWRLDLLADHRVRVQAVAPLAPPVTATGLVAALVRFALVLDPYLATLETAGAGWAGSSDIGRAKICPG